MKKIFYFLLVVAILFTFASCKTEEPVETEDEQVTAEDQDQDQDLVEQEDDEEEEEEEEGEEDEDDEDESEEEDDEDDEEEEEEEPDGYGGPDLEAELIEKDKEIAELKAKVAELEGEEEESVFEGESFITVITPKNGAGFSAEPVEFKGKVSPDTEKIVVTSTMAGQPQGPLYDEYELTQYEAGDEEFVYRAKREYGNLLAGTVNYKFEAFFKDGSTDIVDITIEFQSENIPPTPFIVVDSPNDGASFYGDNRIEFRGHVPINVAKIEVKAVGGDKNCDPDSGFCVPYYEDIYELQKFKHGDKNFVYRASKDYGNLVNGPNAYTFTAYDDQEKSAEVTLTIEYYNQ